MRHAGSFVATMMLAALPLYACAGATAEESDASPPPTDDAGTATASTPAQLRANVRDAFIAEAQWARFYGTSALDGTADASAAFSRLNEAEAMIVQRVAPFAGSDRAAQLAQLLHARAQGFADLVASMKSSAAPEGQNLQSELDDNARLVSQFFIALCPQALSGDISGTLDAETQSLVQALQARASGDNDAAVTSFDAAEQSSITFADTVGLAIAKTFPNVLAPASTTPAVDALDLKLHMNLDEHVFWTRAYVVGQMSDHAVQAELDRAVQTSVDLGASFASIYGVETGAQLQFHVHDDITDAIAFVIAVRSGDQGTIDGISTKWNADAQALATFLTSIDANLDASAISQTMQVHVDRERAMIEAREAKQWDAEAADYDMVLANLGSFADLVSSAALDGRRQMR